MKNRSRIKYCIILCLLVGILNVIPTGNKIEDGNIWQEKTVQEETPKKELLTWWGCLYPKFCFQDFEHAKSSKLRTHFWIWEKLCEQK